MLSTSLFSFAFTNEGGGLVLECEMPMKHLENFWKCSYKLSKKSEFRIDTVFTLGSIQCNTVK